MSEPDYPSVEPVWVEIDRPMVRWRIDREFVTSNWSCRFGNGCKGILPDEAEELNQGCCSLGAHFGPGPDADDEAMQLSAFAAMIPDERWQYRAAADELGVFGDADRTCTRVVDGACIFLNRPGFEVVDHHTIAIVSDGDLMEGISHEAASLAGHYGLGKLIYLYDDNGITIDGSTDLAYTEDATGRFESYGWQVLDVEDGNDVQAIDAAIREAKGETERPTLIRVRTIIGYGSPNKEGTASSHGSPLGDDEIAA